MIDNQPVVPNWQRSVAPDERWGGCRLCQHLRGDMSSIAFPDRIPLTIVADEVDHMVVRPGRVGDTVYTPLTDKPARRAASDAHLGRVPRPGGVAQSSGA